MFSGDAVTTQPWTTAATAADPPAEDQYSGNQNSISYAIGPGTQLQISANLYSVLGNGNTGGTAATASNGGGAVQADGSGGLLATMRTIYNDLTGTNGGTQADLGNQLTNLDTNISSLEAVQATVGSTQDRLQMAGSRLTSLSTTDTIDLGDVQDTDMATGDGAVLDRAVRLPGCAAVNRRHHPDLATQLPPGMNAISVYPGAVMSVEPGDELETESFSTSRFGEVEVIVDSIISFPDGLIGLVRKPLRAAQHRSGEPVPVAAVARRSGDRRCRSPTRTASSRTSRSSWLTLMQSSSGLTTASPADVYVTVTASSVVTDLTVNLKAPILIRDGRGHQVINQADGVTVKTPLFPAQRAQRRVAGSRQPAPPSGIALRSTDAPCNASCRRASDRRRRSGDRGA